MGRVRCEPTRSARRLACVYMEPTRPARRRVRIPLTPTPGGDCPEAGRRRHRSCSVAVRGARRPPPEGEARRGSSRQRRRSGAAVVGQSPTTGGSGGGWPHAPHWPQDRFCRVGGFGRARGRVLGCSAVAHGVLRRGRERGRITRREAGAGDGVSPPLLGHYSGTLEGQFGMIAKFDEGSFQLLRGRSDAPMN